MWRLDRCQQKNDRKVSHHKVPFLVVLQTELVVDSSHPGSDRLVLLIQLQSLFIISHGEVEVAQFEEAVSSVDVKSLFAFLLCNGFAQKICRFFITSFLETIHGKVVVAEKQLSRCVAVDGRCFLVTGVVQNGQIVVNRSIEVAKMSIQRSSERLSQFSLGDADQSEQTNGANLPGVAK